MFDQFFSDFPKCLSCVENVVDDLEGDAEMLPELAERLAGGILAARHAPSETPTGTDEHGGLPSDDLEVGPEVQAEVVAVVELHQLAFAALLATRDAEEAQRVVDGLMDPFTAVPMAGMWLTLGVGLGLHATPKRGAMFIMVGLATARALILCVAHYRTANTMAPTILLPANVAVFVLGFITVTSEYCNYWRKSCALITA